MKIRFWGVRGSIPVPGPETVRVGGNTPSVQISTRDGQVLVLDAGTGIRGLGLDLIRRQSSPRDIVLLLSHTHWDHIEGLPFFAPLRLAGQRVTIVGERRPGRPLEQVLALQMDEAFLPFAPKDLAAEIAVRQIEDGEELAVGAETCVLAVRLFHPGSVLSYRVQSRGRSVVYATDVGHPDTGPDPRLVALASGVDLLIHDTHFRPEERPLHPDWGHSSWLEAVQVARVARVRQLALFHHAPGRSDDELEWMEKEAQAFCPTAFLAREGDEVVI
jgi:phosphoribosyl 1,2-cyclic phosphodiesterase